MIKQDFHTHTWFSGDCSTPFEYAIECAIDQGIETLAITDHYDPGYVPPAGMDIDFELDFPKYTKALTEAKAKFEGKIEIAAGVEVGIMAGQFDVARKNIRDYDYDVVIGSFHALEKVDICTLDFTKVEEIKFIEDYYSYALNCLKDFDDFDILAHASLIDRYTTKMYDYRYISDIIDGILNWLVQKGKALEINTSSFNYQMQDWLPRAEMLKRYKELGGEMITFGSDAHVPKMYRSHFRDAEKFAKALGFKYYCTFRNREPIFNNLD